MPISTVVNKFFKLYSLKNNPILIPNLIISVYIVLLALLHITIIEFYYLHTNKLNYIRLIVDHTHGSIIASALLMLEIFTMFILGLYGWMVYSLINPLRQIKKSADRLGIDINSAPLKVTGKGFVDETVQALHKMQTRIKNLVTVRSHMLAAISHDLRTPLTRLKLRAQLLEDPEQTSKILNDLEEMEAMITTVLSYARDDFHVEKKTKFDLGALITSIYEDYHDTGQNVKFSGDHLKIPFLGRIQAIKRCLTNLINNALKYGNEAQINILLTKENTVIHIEDNGPGIPDHELKSVLRPFYRTQEARKQSSTGVGLGLAIAAEIISSHSGELQLHNRQAGGLCVTITLPIAK